MVEHPNVSSKPNPQDVESAFSKKLYKLKFKLTVLANEVEVESAVGVGPEPALGPVEPGAVVVAAGQVPKGHRDLGKKACRVQLTHRFQ